MTVSPPRRTDLTVDAATLWRSVATTLERVVAPGLPPGVELDTVVQLQGLARFAAARPSDDSAGRAERISRALNAHAVTHDLGAALNEASRTLVAAVARPGSESLRERAASVRRVLIEILDEDIAAVAPLMETFSGHPAEDVDANARGLPQAELDALAGWFGEKLGGPVVPQAASVISGGHSRRMLRMTVVDATDARHDVVVRIEQGGIFGTDGTREAALMTALARAGIPVAPVRWIEPSDRPLGHPFFVMDLVPGRSVVDDTVLDAFVHTLHELHGLDPALVADALGPPPSPEEAVLGQIDHWAKIHHESVRTPVPLLEEAAEWLRRHLHPTGAVSVVHGDPGPGNFLAEGSRIRALTDWEFGHYGDPAEDWAYLAIRGRKVRDPESWYSSFDDLVGVAHPEEVWRSWEAFNSFKGACANLTAFRLFREGIATTPNLLAIGTAVHYRFLRRLADLVGGSPS